MKKIIMTLIFVFPFFILGDDITAVTHGEEAADGLDLNAVVQILKDTNDAEALEQALNDPDLGINNMDLNEDGFVDYIRVVTEKEGDTHVIILQVPLEENEVQDVATIEVEKDNTGAVQVQVHGNELIYGPNYYIRPVGVSISIFPFVNWLFSPRYTPWRPHFYVGYYPTWYRPWRRVSLAVYRPRVTRFATVRVGVFKTSVVVRAPKIYRPRTTVVVKRPMRRSVTVRKTTTVKVQPKTRVRKTTTVKTVRKTPAKPVKKSTTVRATKTTVRTPNKKVTKTTVRTPNKKVRTTQKTKTTSTKTVKKSTTVKKTPSKKVKKTTKVKKTKNGKTVTKKKKTVKKK